MDTKYNEGKADETRSGQATGYATVRDGKDWAVVDAKGRRVTLLGAKCRADQVCDELNRLLAELAEIRDGYDPRERLPEPGVMVFARWERWEQPCMVDSTGWRCAHKSDRTGGIIRWWPLPGQSHNGEAERTAGGAK